MPETRPRPAGLPASSVEAPMAPLHGLERPHRPTYNPEEAEEGRRGSEWPTLIASALLLGLGIALFAFLVS